MREYVPGVVHSIAFSLDGRSNWCAHRNQIAVRAWPSLELLTLHAIATTRLVAAVDGTFLAACAGRVVELDDNAVVLRSVAVDNALALGLDDAGAIVVVYGGDDRFVVDRFAHDGTRTRVNTASFRSSWWMTLLPTKKAIVAAIDDRPPVHVDCTTGVVRADWEWLPKWGRRAELAYGAHRS